MAVGFRSGGVQYQIILVCFSTTTDLDGSSRHGYGNGSRYVEQDDDPRGKSSRDKVTKDGSRIHFGM